MLERVVTPSDLALDDGWSYILVQQSMRCLRFPA